MVDDDILGHLKFGSDIIKSGNLAPKDIYSFLTGDSSWINHEWLGNVLFAIFFSHFGWGGVVCAKAVIILLIVAILAWNIMRYKARGVEKLLLLMFTVFLLGPAIRTARPHIFTCLCLCLLLTLLKQSRLKGRAFPLGNPGLRPRLLLSESPSIDLRGLAHYEDRMFD